MSPSTQARAARLFLFVMGVAAGLPLAMAYGPFAAAPPAVVAQLSR